jgi:hypothetical protein
MERREQYDPEDIENLLQERGFDELLEEERAYVLRHLSGREEYEHMRALLRQVRHEEHNEQPLEADERVRTNVMQAFRAQQRPQWKVWLNTVGGLFQPGEGYAMWRPALALGMLLLLFGVGFYLVNGPLSDSREELAEVRRQKAEEPLPAKTTVNSDTVTSTVTSTVPAAPEAAETGEEGVTATPRDEAPSKAAAPAPSAIRMEEPRASGLDHVTQESDLAEISEEAPVAFSDMEVVKESADDVAIQGAPATTHVVTESEMMLNQSMANASGKVRTRVAETDAGASKRSKALAGSAAVATSRPVSADPGLLDLLSAGW